jgi:hypothetical protein
MMPKFITAHLIVRIAVVVAHTALAADSQVQWTSVEDTRLPVPPAEHPRLYLRAEHVAKLPTRLKHPVLQPAVERLRDLTRNSPQLRVEWDALQYPLWIFDRLGAGNVYNPEQRFVPYLWVYTTRPDGQRLRAGDTFAHSAPRGRPWSEYMGTLLVASYYGDGVLLDQFQRQGGSGGNETLFEVLWRDVELQPKSVTNLPLSRYFGPPFGWMVARTGWGEDAVIAEMKVNEFNFANHQHLDAGAFQVYFKGTLASDSGLYSGSSGAYGSPHCLNYYWRTIAHNSLLVYDPDEDFGRRGYGNDGGQRLPNGHSEPRNLETLLAPQNGYRTGKVLAHGFGPDPHAPDYTLLQGDLTAAYSKKVQEVTRSCVFLNLRNAQVPAALVVFDRVVAAQPDFRKYWLLHTLEEPRLESASATADCTQHGARGRLNLDVLLPPASNAVLAKVGGPGKEYWVFGTNYANDPDPTRLTRSSMETAAWRLELSPKSASAEDHFLAVMQVTDRTEPARWPVRHLDAGGHVGCVLEGPDGAWIVLFNRNKVRSEDTVEFTVAGLRRTRVLVAGQVPGNWQARRAGSPETHHLAVAEDTGAASFEASAGTWTLSKP